MKITQITYEQTDLTLSVPYTIAYESVSKSVNFILKLETDTRLVGYGCASPDLEVTGETEEDVTFAIRDVLIPYLHGRALWPPCR